MFFCFIFAFLSYWSYVCFAFHFFVSLGERTESWVDREIRRLWEELKEGKHDKNLLKILNKNDLFK